MMTEEELLHCPEPELMLDMLRRNVSDRRLRLFAVACCRRIWHLVRDERSRRAVDVAEAFADDTATDEQLLTAAESAGRAVREAFVLTGESSYHPAWSRPTHEYAHFAACEAALLTTWPYGLTLTVPDGVVEAIRHYGGYASAVQASFAAAKAVAHVSHAGAQAVEACDSAEAHHLRIDIFAALSSERTRQLGIWKDLVGPETGYLVSHEERLRWEHRLIPKLAVAIYEDETFEHLPILADALEEAGCSDEEILGHLRGPEPHVRGCWVVDLLLDKT
jgi:hypothetical protein